jgi:hypothetical protein
MIALERDAWLLFLGVVLLNVPILWHRSRPQIAAHPELEAGYRRLIRGLAFWMSLPWLVMGLGYMVGGVQTLRDFLRPAAGGPYVWALWAVVYAELVLLGYWAVWGGGAKALVRHPGVINIRTRSVRRMRRLLVGTAVFGIIWNTGFLLCLL